MEPLLELDRVSKRFGRVVIADGISLAVRPADVFRAVAMMSAPFAGPPSLPFAGASGRSNAATAPRDPSAECGRSAQGG